jgi:hypothetical protein
VNKRGNFSKLILLYVFLFNVIHVIRFDDCHYFHWKLHNYDIYNHGGNRKREENENVKETHIKLKAILNINIEAVNNQVLSFFFNYINNSRICHL